jgi:hypothetical protein
MRPWDQSARLVLRIEHARAGSSADHLKSWRWGSTKIISLSSGTAYHPSGTSNPRRRQHGCRKTDQEVCTSQARHWYALTIPHRRIRRLIINYRPTRCEIVHVPRHSSKLFLIAYTYRQKNQLKGEVEAKKKKEAEQPVREIPQVPSSLFFQANTALVPPYSVLVDTNFLSHTVRAKLELQDSLMDCLYAKATPIITSCVMAELEKVRFILLTLTQRLKMRTQLLRRFCIKYK